MPYRESPANERVGPYRVSDNLSTQLFVTVNGRFIKFSVDKVKQYRKGEGAETDEYRAIIGPEEQVETSQGNESNVSSDQDNEIEDLLSSIRQNLEALK